MPPVMGRGLLMGSELKALTASNFARLQASWIAIEGGTFIMGAADMSHASPLHKATVDSFLMAKNPTTNEEHRRFADSLNYRFVLLAYDPKTNLPKLAALGSRVSDFDKITPKDLGNGFSSLIPVEIAPICLEKDFNHPQQPVGNIGWQASVAYALLHGARLPFEAEYEWAARGPNQNKYGARGGKLGPDVAHYDAQTPIEVDDSKIASMENGLRHLCGNMGTWCMDQYGLYSNESVINPTGPVSGEGHVIRGGSFFSRARSWSLRAGHRYSSDGGQSPDVGLRLIMPQKVK